MDHPATHLADPGALGAAHDAAAHGGDSTLLILGTIVFVLTYIAIALEKKIRVDKTVSALVGSSLMLIFVLREHLGEPGQDEAGIETAQLSAYNKYADFDVIFLLAGMMLIVNLLRETGLFQYVAIKCAKLGGGRPIPVLVLLLVATAGMSAFLDNVTTVLLMAPVTLLVANYLQCNPIPFLIPEVLASNIGGTGTLIGDPPNILVGAFASAVFRADPNTRFDFLAFMQVMGPVVIVAMAAFLGAVLLALRGAFRTTAEERARIMDLNEKQAIKDWPLLRKGAVVMGLTLAGFMVHGLFHLEPGVVAMAGAAVLLMITRKDVEHALAEVEWNTLFFFLGLFIVVKGADKAGLIGWLAEGLAGAIKAAHWSEEGMIYLLPVLVLWISGLLAGVMNNVSYTLAALPIVHGLTSQFHLEGAAGAPLFWALALGACLGGNLTPVGAAANLVVLNIAERNGHAISFGRFMKWGAPCAVGTLLLATGYVLLLAHWAHP